MRWLLRLVSTVLKAVRLRPLAGVSVFFAAGMVFWGGFNWSLEITNTETFCISCHEMQTFVYRDYVTTTHFTNRTGVRASCPDCHVPRDWVHKVARKIAATNELFHWVRGTIDSREKFDARQPALARRVWASMKATDSRECRNCHEIGFMNPDRQLAMARTVHQLAQDWRYTCIDCHKGVVHPLPQGFDGNADMDALHDRIAAEGLDCRLCHEGMAAPPPGEEWD
jgi:cytochrome c-type protein NapC